MIIRFYAHLSEPFEFYVEDHPFKRITEQYINSLIEYQKKTIYIQLYAILHKRPKS